MSKVRGGGLEELPCVRGQWRPGGATPRLRSGAVAGRRHLASGLRAGAERSYPTSEVRAAAGRRHPASEVRGFQEKPPGA